MKVPTQSKARRRILIATRDESLCASIEKLVDPGPRRRFDCQKTGSLQATFDALKNGGADAVFFDLEVASGKSEGAVDAVRALVETGKAPIIILTEVGQESLSLRCLEQGAQEYLDKDDLSTINLRRALGYAISRHRANTLRLRLEHSDKLAALGQLTAGVAHEINNPATYVLGNLRQISEVVTRLRADLGEPKDLELLAEMTRDCQRGVELIASISKELKYFARGDDADYEYIDIAELVSNTSAMTLNEIRYRARFQKNISKVPAIVGSRSKISQILVNLLINAAHAIPEGRSRDNLIEISCGVEDTNVVVRVRDTGCGIAESERKKVFEAYYTTKEHGLGTGLGLSICREIVLLHQGRLSFVSEVGRGTTFTLVLPIKSSLVAEVVTKPQPTPPPLDDQGRRKVLLIDDEPLLIKSLARMLQAHHDVVSATGGAQGIQAIRTQEFDVILCDLMMPEVDGLHVYEALVEHHPHLVRKLVYLSGGVFTDRMSNFLEEMRPKLLDKPVSRDTLLEVIEMVSSRER